MFFREGSVSEDASGSDSVNESINDWHWESIEWILFCRAEDFEKYKQAAQQQGDAGSQFNVGVMYQDGMGTCERPHERSADWWGRAAEQGHAGAQVALGRAYEDGQGVPQSYERAIELYKLSEAQGDARATLCLGMCYSNGWGVDQSWAEARRLYELAVTRGEKEVSPANLQEIKELIQQESPLLDQRVVLRDLDTPALNGTRGTAVEFGFSERDPESRRWVIKSGRYTVRLDGSELQVVKVRAANVEEEEDEEG